MSATHSGLLPESSVFPPLSLSARRVHVFPAITKNPLLAIGQFCDDGYSATFTATTVSLSKNGRTFLIGHRDPLNKLWHMNLAAKPTITSALVPVAPVTLVSNNVYVMRTLSDLVQYHHRSCFSPVVKTWTAAIDAGFYTTWPGLTSALVRKHLPKSVATAKGHLKQDRQNVRSTKPTITKPVPPTPVMTASDLPAEANVRTHCVFAKTVSLSGKVFSDQTGRFPHTSSRGNKYVMVFFDYDSSAILAEPLKSRGAAELLRAFSTLHELLSDRGLRPKLHILDNECPENLEQYIKSRDASFQLASPYMHRTNAAEKAIDIWKCHFISGLSSVDPSFPMHLWCRLIPQATTTLNLLRPSRINPLLSAEALLNGAFDYNKTPLAPPGTKVLVHETPGNRRTWAPHGVDGWYLGSAPEHYRCFRVYIPSTSAERTAKTVEFFPHNCALPKSSSADMATRAALDLVEALKNPAPAAPFASLGSEQLQAIRKLSDIFSSSLQPKATTQPTAPPPRQPVQLHRILPDIVPPAQPRRVAPRLPPLPRVVTQPRSPPRVVPPSIPTPVLTRPPTRRPLPRVAPVTVNIPRRATRQTPSPRLLPHRIEPEADDPVSSRYHLRPRAALAHNVEANVVIDEVSGQSLEYRHLSTGPQRDIWIKALANDLGRLAQGVGTRMPSGTDTIFFIARSSIPVGRKVTYGRLVSTIRPTKAEIHLVRVTVGGDKLDFPGITTTQCASLTTTKCLLNSTVSTPSARFLVLDIKNFYYGTPMERYEYMKLPIKLIPEEIVKQYNLLPLVSDGYIYLEIRKGMPGLKQAGRIANDRLQTHLAKYDYAPVARTPSLWKHATRPVTFSLVVDDFGVKYVGKHHADHLIHALQQMYEISIDWEARLYLGLTMKWDYDKRTVDISMPGYLNAALHKFQHLPPERREDAPHSWTKPIYGASVQYADNPDDSPLLPSDSITLVQKIVGTLLYYAMAVDPTMLVSLGTIASTQSKAPAKTYAEVVWILNYAHSHPDAMIRYKASDMVLHIHSDGSYLSEPKARSRAGGHYFLSDRSPDPNAPPSSTPTLNGPIYSLSRIIKNVMGSAAEAEIGSAYINGQEAVPIRTTLAELGHPQPPTPMQVDNSTAYGFANDTIKQKRSKAIDMRFYWIKDRTRQGQFLIFWRPGSSKLGDYHTKHHSAAHHRLMRSTFLHDPTDKLASHAVQLLLRGCVKSPGTHYPKLSGTLDRY